ncbi:hypothetical protein JCM1841_006674 [Sporobolomyces salmonicolor]
MWMQASCRHVREENGEKVPPDVIEEPTLSDLQHATTILSPATAAALAALLASLPTSNHSRPSQFPFLTITLSHASRSTTNLPVPDLLRGFFELVTALSSEVQQEFGRPDLQELEIRAQATVGSLELLVPWLSRWTNQLIVVMQRERSEARVETGQMAARDEEERDSTMEMVDLEGAMTNLLHSLTHFALSFSPSSSSSPQTRLFDLVHKASALSPSLSNALLSLMLGDLHNILSAHLTPLLTPNLPSPQPSLPPAYLNLDRLPHLLNLLLSLTTLALQTPIASSMDTLGPAVDRLTLLLGSFGIDDLLGPELEGACLSVLEGVWTLLERENAGQVHRASSLLAHLLCPLTALFSLPGLTEHWYVQLNSDGRIVHSKPDPPLIVAAGSVALGFAVLANLALLFRTIDTHPRFFSGVTLAFLSVHTIIDVLALAIFAAEQARPAHYVLSTAFWLTVTSAAIAVAVSALLLIDGMTTRWWRNGGTGLTGKQTSLVISFYMFILVVMIGAVVFRYLLDDVNYLNAIYFSLQTAITTGFGDITPSSTGSRIFAIFWNSLGILSFALLVAFTRATALEAMQEEYKTKERLILARLRKGRSSGAVGSAPCPGVFSRYLAFLTCGIYHTKAQQVEEQAVENLEQEQYSTRDERQDRSLDTGSASKVNPKEEEPELRYEEAIRELRKEREREFRSEVIVSGSVFLVVWLVGAAVYMKLEGWNYFIAFYFCFISFSTIGYGEFTPQTQGGRAFFCAWALAGAGSLTVFFSVIAEAYSSRFKETFQRSLFKWSIIHHKHTIHSAHTHALEPSESQQAPSLSAKEKEGDVRVALLQLIGDTRDHLDHLILSDGTGDSHALDLVVHRVMEEERFHKKNRDEVENDPHLKHFLYLRTLQSKLRRLERLAQEALHAHPPYPPSSISGSSEVTLIQDKEEGNKEPPGGDAEEEGKGKEAATERPGVE